MKSQKKKILTKLKPRFQLDSYQARFKKDKNFNSTMIKNDDIVTRFTMFLIMTKTTITKFMKQLVIKVLQNLKNRQSIHV